MYNFDVLLVLLFLYGSCIIAKALDRLKQRFGRDSVLTNVPILFQFSALTL
jgi:hypothetical protein